MQQRQTISWLDCDMRWQVDFKQQPVTTSWVAGQRSSSKALPKSKLAPKKGLSRCLMVYSQSDPLHLSESLENHYIWEVCSANQWDALKTAMPAASFGQQKGPNSSPQQRPTERHTTNASLNNWATNLISWQPTTTSSSILTSFCRENTSTTSRRQKMLSKNSLNPETWIFML